MDRFLLSVVAIITLTTLYQISLALYAQSSYLIEHMAQDDTFLYLQIARNWADTGLPTFDGTTVTNGFQWTWQILLLGMAKLIPDRVGLLRAACVASALLNSLTTAVIFQVAKRMADRRTALAAVVFWSTYLFIPRACDGMESSLHGVIFGCALLLTIDICRKSSKPNGMLFMLCGALWALNGLTRLDSGIISACMAVPVLHLCLRLKRLGLAAAFCLFPVLALAVYVLINMQFSGVAIPISGSVKHYWAREALDLDFPDQIRIACLRAGQSVCGAVMRVSGGGEQRSFLWVIVLGALSSLGMFSYHKRRQMKWLLFWICACSIHVSAVSWHLLHFGGSYWYYQPLRMLASVVLGHIIHIPLGSTRLRHASAALWVALVVIWIHAMMLGVRSLHTAYEDARAHRQHPVLQMAAWIGETEAMPDHAKVGSWNAGTLGFFAAPTRVINLDGLVQDKSFLEDVVRKGAWKEYLRKHSIHYLADMNAQDQTQTYGKEWDVDILFRSLVPFDKGRVLWRKGNLYVLDIRPWLQDNEGFHEETHNSHRGQPSQAQ